MYINTIPSSQHYWMTVIGRDKAIRIFVDDEEMFDVTEADDVAGYIIQLERDEHNMCMRRGDEFARKLRSGKVEIRII